MDINDVLNSYRPSTNTRCGSLVENPKWLTQGMSEYLESDEWKEKQSGDFMLYRAANEALDATIQILGPELSIQCVNQTLVGLVSRGLASDNFLSCSSGISNL